jgi:tRNA-splicing ligase RtcB
VFIELAKKDMKKHMLNLPDSDLAYLKEGSQTFDDYVFGVSWAQRFARLNREVMLKLVIEALRRTKLLPEFQTHLVAVNW